MQQPDFLFGVVPVPPLFAQWNRAMRGAYKKGAAAFFSGNGFDDCPYRDKRKTSGGLSWSRAFIACWQDGYADAQRAVDGAKYHVEGITGDNRRPGMPSDHQYLVRYRLHPSFGWTGCRTFARLEEAGVFAGSLTPEGDLSRA